MALFNLKKTNKHFVQSYENPEYEGIRIYFNGENEKKSNTNMLRYAGKEEYEKIKFEPFKYKYTKEEMTEAELRSIGINPNRTAHKIFTGPNELKKEMKELINIKNEIDNIEKTKNSNSNNEIKIYEENITRSQTEKKINIENKDKQININLQDELGNNKAKGYVSNSGKEIHIHINLGSFPHIEKATLENQESIKKLQEDFNKSLDEAKNTITKMEERLKEKNYSYSNNFSSNFHKLTNNQKLSKAEIAFEAKKDIESKKSIENSFNLHKNENNPEIHSHIIKLKNGLNTNNLNTEIPNISTTDIIKNTLLEMNDKKTKNIEPQVNPVLNNLQEHVDKKEEEENKEGKSQIHLSYKDAIKETKIDDLEQIFFRGRYQKKDSVQGHTYEEIKNIYQTILKENYDKEIYSVEKNDNYSIIKNNIADKIQNYIVNKDKLDDVMSNPDTPFELKKIVEKYKMNEVEKTEKSLPAPQKEETIEMR